MTADVIKPDAGAKDSAPPFPAIREVVSGHDAPYVSSEELDARTFSEAEQLGRPWSWQRQ